MEIFGGDAGEVERVSVVDEEEKMNGDPWEKCERRPSNRHHGD